ncbi:MAG TPA: heparinase II/III-family protein, partial [Anaerolineae bacterium]|nr:heparinase II/III-family protein [Anaerolineae bacterium]
MMMPDGRLPDVNDGGWRPVAPLLDGAVGAYPEREDFRWAYTEGAKGAPPDEMSVAFPYAGYYIMRTGWAPDAAWALFDGGPFGYGHQHEDKLNLLLHAYGRLLLTEGGNYAYDSSEMRRYVLSTRAHNTIRIDGQDQNRRLNYDREAFDVTERAGAAWHTTHAYDVVEATYDEGYGPEAARTVTHRRKAIMIKEAPGGLGPFLLAIDRLIPHDEAEHSAQILWHLDAFRATVDGVAVHSQADGTANLSILPAAAPGLRASLVAGQESPEWQGWVAVENHQQGQYTPTPTALYELRFNAPLRLVTLLYPTPPAEECPVAGVEAPTGIDATQIRLVLADGSTVDLSEDTYTFDE